MYIIFGFNIVSCRNNWASFSHPRPETTCNNTSTESFLSSDWYFFTIKIYSTLTTLSHGTLSNPKSIYIRVILCLRYEELPADFFRLVFFGSLSALVPNKTWRHVKVDTMYLHASLKPKIFLHLETTLLYNDCYKSLSFSSFDEGIWTNLFFIVLHPLLDVALLSLKSEHCSLKYSSQSASERIK